MAFLTERQRDILDLIRQRIETSGVAPTLQEISDSFGYSSTASAQKHVNILVKKGLLVREKHQKRGLTLSRGPGERDSVILPLLGAVAAGSPIEVVADDEEVMVPPDLVGSGDNFALRVRGVSMIDEGIHDGDLIIVRRREEARDGETVVALVDGEVTLKQFFCQKDGTILLRAANETIASVRVPADRVRVQGVVVGLVRKY